MAEDEEKKKRKKKGPVSDLESKLRDPDAEFAWIWISWICDERKVAEEPSS